MDDWHLAEVGLDQAPWHQAQALLDACFPRPPRDVFERVVAASHRRQRLWLASEGSQLLGMVMLSPHSKGGHLDNLAVAPGSRGRGIAQALVNALLRSIAQQGPGLVTLTTRIPHFFAQFGFKTMAELADGSIAMLLLLPTPASAPCSEP
jgi:ribosomal protein S18 acetylase RimI-like enzyme